VRVAATSLGTVREHAPEAYRLLQLSHDEAYRAVDPALLELARLRIVGMLDPGRPVGPAGHGVSDAKVQALANWSASDLFTPAERACLAFAEQFALYVADVDDDLIDDLLAELPPDEVYGLVNAIYVVDTVERLRIVSARILDAEGGAR